MPRPGRPGRIPYPETEFGSSGAGCLHYANAGRIRPFWNSCGPSTSERRLLWHHRPAPHYESNYENYAARCLRTRRPRCGELETYPYNGLITYFKSVVWVMV